MAIRSRRLILSLLALVSVAPTTNNAELAEHAGKEWSSVSAGSAGSALIVDTQEPLLSGTETMIPMRDGVRLYTQVYAPKPAGAGTSPGPYPIILLRTPYGTGPLNPARVATSLAHLVADGYIFVQQDIRG